MGLLQPHGRHGGGNGEDDLSGAMAAFRTLDDAGDLKSKRVLLRVDLNVPVQNGQVTDATRIERVAATIKELSDRGAKLALLAHFERPKGKRVPEMSLAPIVPAVAQVIGRPVGFVDDCIGPGAEAAVARLGDGGIVVLENTRFHPGEEANDPAFAAALARVGDVYVNDAFSAAHRAHASTEGIAHLLPAYAGRAMQDELEALDRALANPRHPVLAVVGGAKVSSKIDLLANLLSKVDALVIGGGMANTFMAARGAQVGRSLNEPDLAQTARQIMTQAAESGTAIILPSDVVVATEFKANAPHQTVTLDQVSPDGMILDAGEGTVEIVKAWIDQARTLVWNGPLGAFELEPFDRATVAAARHAAQRTREGKLLSVAGGGDTVAALNHAGVADAFSYVSTAGGAFLEWLEGKPLPGVDALRTERR
jgi:phosphoglycerate kinase